MGMRDAFFKSRPGQATLKFFTGSQLGSSLLFGTAVPTSYWPSITPEAGRITGMVQDPSQHSVVASIIRLYGDAFGTANLSLLMNDEPVEEHPLLSVLRNPMPGLGWRQLMVCVADGLISNGNVYFVPINSKELRLLDWRYVSPPRMSAMYYEYKHPMTGAISRYSMDDVVHLRWQMAPDGVNGVGPLKPSVLREIATDTSAAEYTDTILRRMGVPGVVATPGKDETVSPPEADAMRIGLNTAYTGGNRGMAMVTSKRFDFHEVGGAMQRADMRQLRWVPEERICSPCGVPPALLNIGTGSEQVRIGATLQYTLKEWWAGKVMPRMTDIAEQLTYQLVPYYGGLDVYRLAPDFTHAPVIAQIEAERMQQQLDAAVTGYHSGLMGFEECRARLGLDEARPADLLDEPFAGTRAIAIAGKDR